MYFKILFLGLFITILNFTNCNSQNELYISPEGDDNNPGTVELPLKTIHAAKEKISSILKSNPSNDIIVWLGNGTYVISKPELFKPNDSGNESMRVNYKAIAGAMPVISGGSELTSWKKRSDGLWETLIKWNKPEAINIRELFVNGKRAIRARHPNSGFLRIKKVGKDKRTNFYFRTGDFPIPENFDNTELVLLHDWSISRVRLDTIIDNKNQLIACDTIGARQPSFFTLNNWEKSPRYYLENASEFIDQDFEWCFVKSSQKVILKLSPTMHPDSLRIVVPYSDGLLFFDGSEKQPVENIRFSGITFSYSQWQIPERGYSGVQACHYDPWPSGRNWESVPAAVSGKWMKNIIFENCTFEHLGGSGLWMGMGSKDCKVNRCTFRDISGNGIMIGEGRSRIVGDDVWWKSAPHQASENNTIELSRIMDCGKQFYGAVGIWCGLTAYTSLIGNEISNLPYSGISVGWMWNPEPTPCESNLIEGNHIYNIMEILSDGGGIYMLGLQPGSRIVRNHIHDVKLNVGRAESNGIFLDEGITDVLVEDNLIYNIAKSPIRFHKANYNLVKDNILVCSDTTLAIQYNNTDPDKIEKVNNRLLKKSNIEDTLQLDCILKEWNSQGYK